jgi:hypothetical protein
MFGWNGYINFKECAQSRLEYFYGIIPELPEGTEDKPGKISVSILPVLAKIRSRHCPNTNQKDWLPVELIYWMLRTSMSHYQFYRLRFCLNLLPIPCILQDPPIPSSCILFRVALKYNMNTLKRLHWFCKCSSFYNINIGVRSSRSRKPRIRAVGIRHTDHVAPSILALASPTSGHSVGIVRSRTQATEFSFRVRSRELRRKWDYDITKNLSVPSSIVFDPLKGETALHTLKIHLPIAVLMTSRGFQFMSKRFWRNISKHENILKNKMAY